jgi:hypothetical protein
MDGRLGGAMSDTISDKLLFVLLRMGWAFPFLPCSMSFLHGFSPFVPAKKLKNPIQLLCSI